MEDTLRDRRKFPRWRLEVLILVLMEDTLRDIRLCLTLDKPVVLILVLMEDTLRVARWFTIDYRL